MKRIDVTGCSDCPLRSDSHCGPDSACAAVQSRRHPTGRTIPPRIADGTSPDWCPLDSGDVAITRAGRHEPDHRDAEIAALREQVRVLREALAPFARLDGWGEPKRARAALAATEET